MLQQWLIEGKFTEEEALSQSYDMLSAGIDTVNNNTWPGLGSVLLQSGLYRPFTQNYCSRDSFPDQETLHNSEIRCCYTLHVIIVARQL